MTTVSSHPTTFKLSRSTLSAVRHSKIDLEVALIDALRVSKIRWTWFIDNANLLFSNSVRTAISCGVSYMFHCHILATVKLQSKQVCHTTVCVSIKFCQFLASLTLFSANFTTINVFGSVIWGHRSGNNVCCAISNRAVIFIFYRLLSGVGRFGLQCNLDRVYSSFLRRCCLCRRFCLSRRGF